MCNTLQGNLCVATVSNSCILFSRSWIHTSPAESQCWSKEHAFYGDSLGICWLGTGWNETKGLGRPLESYFPDRSQVRLWTKDWQDCLTLQFGTVNCIHLASQRVMNWGHTFRELFRKLKFWVIDILYMWRRLITCQWDRPLKLKHDPCHRTTSLT